MFERPTEYPRRDRKKSTLLDQFPRSKFSSSPDFEDEDSKSELELPVEMDRSSGPSSAIVILESKLVPTARSALRSSSVPFDA